MPGPAYPVFSADGETLAVGGNDSLIRLYETATFTATQQLAGMPSGHSGYEFSPDGSRLASATTDQVRIWEISPEGLPALGNFRVTGGFP